MEPLVNLIVNYLPLNLTDDDLRRLFERIAFVRFAKLEDAEQAMRALNGTIPPGFKKPLEIKMTQNTKGKPSSVYNLPELMDTTDQSYASLNDTTLSIVPFYNNNQNGQFVPFGGQMTEGKNLYVRNFSPKIDEMSMCELFRSYGNVLWLKIARHRDGTSRKYGFVEMETENGATQAIRQLNGIFIMGNDSSYDGKWSGQLPFARPELTTDLVA
ncbi:ELAV-like protein 3 [Chrysoperla carnea]|uniref:ELAV-like protein 3 n=1 Tax=Chrysoperla carnea TaxID=189513 RepID=UPI001D088D3F|nr:ELAV-like protein 3 [Chrysoperla carnea]